MPRKPKKSVVQAETLAAIGEDAFPDVVETCNDCKGKGILCETVHGLKETCCTCRGVGFIVREMTPREEHFWIIKLIADPHRDYQLR